MFNTILDRLEETIISLLIAGATVLIFVAVIHRYGATVPFLFPYLHQIDMTWAQEVCIYMFVWMAKFGAAYGVRRGVHVGVDVLVNRLGSNQAKRVILFGLVGGAVFTGLICALGASFVYEQSQFDTRSNDLEAPMWIVYLAIPLGSGLMCFRSCRWLGRSGAPGPCRMRRCMWRGSKPRSCRTCNPHGAGEARA